MLDTNIVSELIRNPAGPAAQRARTAGSAVCVSVIVAAELRYGCAKKGSSRLLRKVEEFLSQVPVLPFDVPTDGEYGSLRAELETMGRPIGSNDLLIAAHACALGATLVTANVSEFRRVRGLTVESWLA
jgi:tRNA(fMet)-specific endonuclease VapC